MAKLLKTDPSRTKTLRDKATREMKKRFKRAKKQIVDLVIKEDAFGLQNKGSLFLNKYLAINQRFEFMSDANKIIAFQAWFASQVEAGLLFVKDTEEPWLNEYVESAYKRGVVRGFTQVRPAVSEEGVAFFEGTKAEFLTSAFAAPEVIGKVQTLFTRVFINLKDITNAMDSQISIILAQGLIDGLSAQAIAKNMTDAIDKLERKRALKLARTEIIRAHAEGQLDSYERLGIEEVGIMAEYSTAGDDKVCEECEPLEGIILTVDEARGMIPRHPNCRCAFKPALKDNKKAGQVWEAAKVRKRIKKSLVSRKKEGTSPSEAREQTTWVGADKEITGEGRND